MVAIYKANREHVTAAAVLEDGEVVSGSLPPDDYNLAWIDAESHVQAPALAKHFDSLARTTPKSWVKYTR